VASNPSKLRVDIRFYCDLISVGIFTPKESLPTLGGLLTNLTSNPDDLANIGIIMTFCRYCGHDFAGLLPRKLRQYIEENKDSPSSMIPANADDKFLPVEKQKNVMQLLKEYYKNTVKKLVKDFKVNAS
jgi:regulator of nonsense transcripts 2